MKKLFLLTAALVLIGILFTVGISAAATDVTGNVKFIYQVDNEFNNIGVIHEDAKFVIWSEYTDAKGYALMTADDVTAVGQGTKSGTGTRKLYIDGAIDPKEYYMVWLGSTKRAEDGNDGELVYTINIETPGTYEFIFAGTAQRKSLEEPTRGLCYKVDGGEKYQIDCNDILFTAGAYNYTYFYENTIQDRGMYYCVGYVYGIKVDLTAGQHTISYYNMEDLYSGSRLNYYGFYYQPYVEEIYKASGTIMGSDVSWYLNNAGTLVIEGVGAIPDYSAASDAPWSAYADEIKKVFVRDKITAVGNNAFGNLKNLETAVAGSGITSIGDSAFENDEKMISCCFSSATATIGKNAFKGCKALTSITLLDNLTAIGEGAFYGCSALTEVLIGNGLAEIPKDAFYGCTALKTLKIGKAVTTIGNNAFKDCSAITKLTVSGNALKTVDANAFGGAIKVEKLYAVGFTQAEWKAITGIGDAVSFDIASFSDIDIDNTVTAGETTGETKPKDTETDKATETTEKKNTESRDTDKQTVSETKAKDTEKAPTTDAPKDTQKKTCGGITAGITVIAAVIGSMAFVIVKKKY